MDNRDYLHKFRRRLHMDGNSQGEIETNELRDNFNEMDDEKLVPTVHTVKYIKREDVGVDLVGTNININIEDVSETDQKTNDEKFMHFKWELDVESGDQIYWHNNWWTLYHQERKSVQASKTFIAKRCNFNYMIEIEGIKYYFPVHLMNLTLYSDGMADQTYMSNQDGSRRITISDNSHSKFVKIGTRIMLSEDTIYEVCHIDDFTRHGVKDCMLKQVFMTSRDDKENLVAWNEFNIPKENKMDEDGNVIPEIIGTDIVRLGAYEIFVFDGVNKNCTPKWEIVSEDNCLEIDTSYDNSSDYTKIRLKCKPDPKYLGTIATITATIDPGLSCTKEIRIGGMF